VLQIGTDLIAPQQLFVSSNAIKQKLRRTQETYKKIQQMVNQSTSPLLSHLKAAVGEKKISLDEVESLLAVVVYALAPLHTVFWVLYNLARHPEAQRKLAEEIEVSNSHYH
jgi:cytochrome P450